MKARIGHFVVYQGSFHCLKGANLLNDEVINIYSYACCVILSMGASYYASIDCRWIFEVASFTVR